MGAWGPHECQVTNSEFIIDRPARKAAGSCVALAVERIRLDSDAAQEEDSNRDWDDEITPCLKEAMDLCIAWVGWVVPHTDGLALGKARRTAGEVRGHSDRFATGALEAEDRGVDIPGRTAGTRGLLQAYHLARGLSASLNELCDARVGHHRPNEASDARDGECGIEVGLHFRVHLVRLTEQKLLLLSPWTF